MNPLPPLKTFIIYSSKDRELRQQLESHLQALVDLKWIALWSDKEIAPGERWDTAIKNQLAQADLFLMLVSVDFYNSGYIREEEFKTAVERMERGDSIVVPIIARPCDWEVYPVIKDLQVLPPGGEAVTDTDHWKDREKAWRVIASKLRERIQGLRTEREAKQVREAQLEAKRVEKAEQRLDNERVVPNSPMPLGKWLGIGAGTLAVGLVLWAMLPQISGEGLPNPTNQSGQTSQPPEFDTLLPFEPTMLRIPGGTFQMGQSGPNIGGEGYSSREQPVHRVTISPFYLASTETTNAQFCAFLNEKGNQTEGGATYIDLEGKWDDEKCRIFEQGTGYRVESGYENHPVILVRWYGAKAYCDWLTTKTGKKYRLPTEAEWEYAAGNGEKHTKYSWGNPAPVGKQGGNVADETAKKRYPDWEIFEGYTDGYVYTAPVAQFNPNDFGLYDMSGNVAEWCADWYDEGYYAKSPDKDPQGPEKGESRVERGGSWLPVLDPRYFRVSSRNWFRPDSRYGDLGFRAARD